ncbi:hypothetical protein GQ53DRAFT_840867 [Thozetella sp. PMI_491]|nr:hypothetical protein GQ53DRAFT_840867 [Thozetella sp. PMI_491]
MQLSAIVLPLLAGFALGVPGKRALEAKEFTGISVGSVPTTPSSLSPDDIHQVLLAITDGQFDLMAGNLTQVVYDLGNALKEIQNFGYNIQSNMDRSFKHLITASALAYGFAAAQTNPAATGACSPTRGGANACGPNGSEAWLNSGLKGNGWNPPFLDINKLTHISLSEYYTGVGKPCQKYDQYFQSSGKKYNIDPAILAFLAMQESSCDANEGGPTPGLMQCDPANCQNGQSSCQFPIQDNVDCGAWVLRSALDASGQNAVHAIGSYNGWFNADDGWGLNGGRGITEGYPCSGEGQSNGLPQNLNYIHETLNGWFQGFDMYGDDQDLDGSYNCQGFCGGGSLC